MVADDAHEPIEKLHAPFRRVPPKLPLGAQDMRRVELSGFPYSVGSKVLHGEARQCRFDGINGLLRNRETTEPVEALPRRLVLDLIDVDEMQRGTLSATIRTLLPND
jgi:hypothetical protein